MINDQQIEKIITRSIISEITGCEKEVLDKWINESPDNRNEYEAYEKLWKKSESLVYSGVIDTELSLSETKKRIKGNRRRNLIVRLYEYAGQAAAVLLLSVMFSALYLYFSDNTPENSNQAVFQEIKTAFGTQTKVILDDSTVVWLNSGSSLRFPATFYNTDERRVELSGEGYFEVSGDTHKPFVVHTPELDVKVHGTAFNVTAYKDYKMVSVALMEGKVSLLRKSGDLEKELLTMNPDDIVEFDLINKKIYRSEIINRNKHKGWKDGYIVFFDDPIEIVRQRLEKWYNVDIQISDPMLNNYRFTATFLDESLEQVLKLLSISSPMAYKIIPAEINKDNTYGMRRVVLSVKK